MFGDMNQFAKLLELLMSDTPLDPIAEQLSMQADPEQFDQGMEQAKAAQVSGEGGLDKVVSPEQMTAQFGAPAASAPTVPIRGGVDTPIITPAVENTVGQTTPFGGGEDIRNTIGYTGTNPLVPTEPPQEEDDKLQTALQAWAMMQAGQQGFAPPQARMPSLGSAGLAQALIPQLYANNPAGVNRLPQVQTLLNQATGGRV